MATHKQFPYGHEADTFTEISENQNFGCKSFTDEKINAQL
jgi:hypothetical protein